MNRLENSRLRRPHNLQINKSEFDFSQMITKRMNSVKVVILVCALIAVGSLVYYQLIAGSKIAKQAEEIRTTTDKILAHRGDIVDANGNTLATSVDEYMITVSQNQVAKFKAIDCTAEDLKRKAKIKVYAEKTENGTITDFEKGEYNNELLSDKCHEIDGHPVGANGAVGIARIMAATLGRSSVELGYRMSGNSEYAIVAKNVKPEQERELLKKHIREFFYPVAVVNRAYPNGNVAGEEIGTASTELRDGVPQITAKSGIEMLMNKELGGTDGEIKYERGALGERIPMAPTDETAAVEGRNVKSTLDIDVQWKLQQLLDDTQKKWGADYGYGVVEEIKTGRIIAIGCASEAMAGSDDAAKTSRAITRSFEPGSTAKVLAAEELIQSGLSDPEKHYSVTGKYRTRNGQDIEDAHQERPTTQWTLAGIIAQSWNTGTVMASEDMSDEQRVNMLKRFGMGKPTALNFPGEASAITGETGVVHDKMDGRMRHTVLFGQGFSATALQMVNAYSAIANGGIDPQPKIVDAVQDEKGVWHPWTNPKVPQEKQVMANPDAAEKTMQILEVSVRDGIAKPAQIDRYRIGGKSGTAEMNCDGEYQGLNCNMRNFISVMPMDNPQFAVGMFFYGKKGHEIWGSVVAVPPVTEMNQFLIQKYAIPPSAPAGFLPAVTW